MKENGFKHYKSIQYRVEKNKGCFNAPNIYVEECGSLFDVAREYIQGHKKTHKESTAHGTTFLSDQQHLGRGTQGRTWLSEKAKSLLTVLVCRQNKSVKKDKWSAIGQSKYQSLTKEIALAIIYSIQQCYFHLYKKHCAFSLEIKEPNDVLLQKKK